MAYVEEGILRYRKLASHNADKTGIKEMQIWLAHPRFCSNTLSGVESDIWGSIENPDSYAPDLIPLFPTTSGQRGLFAQWFNRTFIRWLHRKILYRFSNPDADGLTTYNADILDIVSSFFDFLVSIFLIYSGIYVLGFKSSQVLRVIIFTTVTSVCIAVFGNQKLFVVVAA